MGLDWLDNTCNFFGGFADTITFGGSSCVRECYGGNEYIDEESGCYSGGGWAGTGIECAIGGGLIKQGCKKVCKEATEAVVVGGIKSKCKDIAKCEAIWAAYKALKCKGCKGCVTKDEAKERAACLTAETAGRALYLKRNCDYILPGSIAKGSKLAEKNHRTELANKTRALATCVAKSF